MLWEFPGDGPDNYMSATGDPVAADRLDAARVLRGVWRTYGIDGPFPGLARASAQAGRGTAAADPFGTLAKASGTADPPTAGWVLMLVPVNRPADVLSALGPQMTEVMSDDALTAVLRSWEERFHTVVTTVGAGTLGMVVDNPPRSPRETRKLAAEHAAFAPEDDALFRPGSGAPHRELRPGRIWQFGWPD